MHTTSMHVKTKSQSFTHSNRHCCGSIPRPTNSFLHLYWNERRFNSATRRYLHSFSISHLPLQMHGIVWWTLTTNSGWKVTPKKHALHNDGFVNGDGCHDVGVISALRTLRTFMSFWKMNKMWSYHFKQNEKQVMHRRRGSFSISILPGPQQMTSLNGNPITSIVTAVPPIGNEEMHISVMCYNNKVWEWIGNIQWTDHSIDCNGNHSEW